MACTQFHLYTILIASLFLPSCIAKNNGNGTMGIGTVLSTSAGISTWVSSPSGDFTFGLHQINTPPPSFPPSGNTNILPVTIVWWARAQDSVTPSSAPKGSRLTLTADQGLVLTYNGKTYWRSPLSQAGFARYCFLNDTGNLVVADSNGTALWDSFGHPRDTFLPSQTMMVGSEVCSKRSETDFTRGRFRLILEDNGNLVLKTRSLNPLNTVPYGDDTIYYASRTNSSDPGSFVVQVVTTFE